MRRLLNMNPESRETPATPDTGRLRAAELVAPACG